MSAFPTLPDPVPESAIEAPQLAIVAPARSPGWSIAGFSFYLRVRTRFFLTVAAGLTWAAFSTWIALGWIHQLAHVVGLPLAIFVIAGIAIVPGYLNVHLVASLLSDRPRPLNFDWEYPAITILIAAYNEEARIRETLEYVLRQDYGGALEIVVADDGSTDKTREIANAVGAGDERVRVVTTDHAS